MIGKEIAIVIEGKEIVIEKVVTEHVRRIVNEKRNVRKKKNERKTAKRNGRETASVAAGKEKREIARTGIIVSGIGNDDANGRKAERRVVHADRNQERMMMKITNEND